MRVYFGHDDTGRRDLALSDFMYLSVNCGTVTDFYFINVFL